jgi:hypothetical protein
MSGDISFWETISHFQSFIGAVNNDCGEYIKHDFPLKGGSSNHFVNGNWVSNQYQAATVWSPHLF